MDIDKLLEESNKLSQSLIPELDNLQLDNVGERLIALSAATVQIIALSCADAQLSRDEGLKEYIKLLKEFNSILKVNNVEDTTNLN